MKHYLIILSVILVASGCVTQKSFHRGAVVVDFNTGFDAYRTTQYYQKDLAGQPRDTSVTSSAASANYAIGVEVGLGKHFGIGLRSKTNTFLNNVDAITRKHADIRSQDLIVSLNIHPIVRKRFDLILGADFGMSGLNLQFENKYNHLASGRGSYIAPYINPRFYVGRFGFNFKTTLPYLNYQQFLSSNETSPGNYMLTKWKGSGLGFSVGVQLHLF